MMLRKVITFLFPALLATVLTSAATAQTHDSVEYEFETEASQPFVEYGRPTSDPKLNVRASGAVYLSVVSANSSLGLASSSDGGDSFAPPTPISREGHAVSSHGENSPTFSFGRSTDAYALWEERTGEGLETELLFSGSNDFGRSWNEPVVVTDKATPSTNAFSNFTVAPNGHIYVVWLDGRDRGQGKPGTSAVYLAKSIDGGQTFKTNIAVAHDVCPCCRPAVIADARGTVHVSWRNVYEDNIRDMAMATSTDGGESFGERVRIAHDNWQINGCPHCGASMVKQGNRLWVSWYSDGDGSNSGVRLNFTDDGGKTFSEPTLVSGEVLDATRPNLTLADDGRLLLVFQGRDPNEGEGWAPSGAYLVEIDSDQTPSAPIAVPGHNKAISYPVVAGGSLGRVVVAWTERGENGRQIRLVRGRRVSSKQ